MTVSITGSSLTVAEVLRVARGGESIELDGGVEARVTKGRAIVERALAGGETVYGLTTGVGVRKRATVAEDMATFNRRLLREHRVGQGAPAPADVVRAQLLLTINGFSRGSAGVRMELLEHLVARLNGGDLPVVRMLGSIGMSDLPANADLADGVLGDFALAAKEGLALLNTGAFSTALAALALADADRLLATLDVAAALDVEALAGNPSPLSARFRELLDESFLFTSPPRELQDPLSFRCISQLHDAAHSALAFARGRVDDALNASQENPLVLLDEERIVGTGAFDVIALAQAMDIARVALAPMLTAASERVIKLLQSPVTGLPEGLAAEGGLAESGLSELGVPVQALAAEAKLLAQPVSIETMSTSHHEGIEDRITLAPLAARRLAEQTELGLRIAAIELTVAAQAVDLRGAQPLGAATRPLYELTRATVPFTAKGEALPQDLQPLVERLQAYDRNG